MAYPAGHTKQRLKEAAEKAYEDGNDDLGEDLLDALAVFDDFGEFITTASNMAGMTGNPLSELLGMLCADGALYRFVEAECLLMEKNIKSKADIIDLNDHRPGQSMDTAPTDGTVIQITTENGHTFKAKKAVIQDAHFNDETGKEEDVSAWIEVDEGTAPDCWTGGICWGSNEDGVMSDWPISWKPVEAADHNKPTIQ